MSDKFEERAPGLTFWHKGASRFTVPGTAKLKAKITLECDIQNEALWDEVEKKFRDGYRVYASDDFHIVVIDALRDGHKDLETQLQDSRRELAREREARERADAELARFRSLLGNFGSQIRGE